MKPIRYARWAAVSTAEQTRKKCADAESIDVQLEKAGASALIPRDPIIPKHFKP